MYKLSIYIIISYLSVIQLTAQNNNSVKDDPKGAWEFERMRTADPETGEIPFGKYEEARAIAKNQILDQRKKGQKSFGNWVERGPNNIGGRTRAIMWDPNDPDHKKVWAGGVDGGLWVNEDITDENSEWSLAFSNEDGFAISAITYDKNNTGTFYLGTGELWPYYFSYASGFNGGLSTGNTYKKGRIWKGINNGTSWTLIDNEILQDSIGYINKLIVDNNHKLYAATDKGLYVFNSSTWINELDGIISDIEIYNNNNVIVAVGGGSSGIFLKQNNSDNYNEISGSLNNNCDRIEIAVKNDDENIIYAIGIQKGSDQDVKWFVKSTDGGANWANLTIPEKFDACMSPTNDHFTEGQGVYNIAFEVSPADPDYLILGGVDLFKSTIGGNDTWERISANNKFDLCDPYVHADQHNVVFNPTDPNVAIISNDGGVWYGNNLFHATNDPQFSPRNNNFNSSQFYSCYQHPLNEYIIGGTQDNGTLKMENNSLEGSEVTGGDGGFCFIDQDNPSYQISSLQHWEYRRSLDGGNVFLPIGIPQSNKGFFINPTDYDQDLKILYTNYSPGIIRRIKNVTTPVPLYSTSIDINLTNTTFCSDFSAIKSSIHSEGTLFVSTSLYQSGFQGCETRVCKVVNANSTPTTYLLNSIDNNFNGYITCIEIGSSDNNLIIASATSSSLFDNIYVSSDMGSTWQSKQGNNLPKVPIYWAVFNPNNYDQVLIATEVGLYKTDNINQSSPNWELIDIAPGSDPSLSLVRCDMIRVRPSDSKVYVATHGRGIWESDIFMDGTPVPDLIISDVNPDIPSAELNETIIVDVIIKNIGNSTAAYNKSKCYISDDNILDDSDLLLCEKNIGTINAGEYIISNNWQFLIPGSIGTGNKYIIYKADANEEVDEGSHENNNTLAVPITIYPASSGGSGPDLTVLNEFVSKRVIQQGQSFSVNCDIMNQGDQDATGGWKQKWYLSTDQTYSSNDLQLDYLVWAFLPSGDTSYNHREMTMPSNVADGAYHILIYIDADQELTETVESNNIKSLPITVGTIPVPSLYSPTDHEEEVSLTPTFYWEDLGDDVDSYDFSINDYITQNGNTYLQQVYYKGNLTTPEWKVTNFNFDYDEGYLWTARCRIDGTPGEWAIVNSFQTKHYLNKPVLYDPNNYITNEPLTPTFTWNNVNNADSYRLVIAVDEEFDDEVEDWSGLTDNWFTIPPNYLDTATTYYWRVRAYTGSSHSAYSQVFQFNTGGDIEPGVPENLYPEHDSLGVSLTPKFVWETGNGVTLSYQLDIASDSVFNNIVITQDNITTTNYFVQAGYLSGLSKYYWRVRAWNGAGYSAFSDCTAFTTTTEGGPGTIKWTSELGNFSGTPAFDYQGYLWCSISNNLAKLNPITGDTLFTMPKYGWHEFNEGITLSHDGHTIYTVVAASVFGDGDGDHVAALDTDGNLLWHYDTYCGNVSKPALDVSGNLYVNLSDGYPPYENEASVISLDPNGSLRWRGLVFDDHEEFITCPVVGGNKVFLGREKVDNVGSVFALNTSNGSIAWDRDFPEDMMRSDVPGISNLGFTFNSYSNNYLYYLNSSNGNNLSGWPFNSNLDNFRAATVIDENGNLFNGTDEKDGSSFVYALNQNGSVKWQNQIYLDYRSSQVIGDNGLLYFGLQNNVLFAVNKETGVEAWSLNLNRFFDEMAIGPDGTLYVSVSNPDALIAIETGATGLNSGHWPVKGHDYQGTNCYDHVDLIYSPTLLDFSLKNDQDTTRTIENFFSYDYLNIATHYKISEDSLFSDCDWIALDSNYYFHITSDYDTKTVYFVMKNDNGISDTVSDNIDYVTSVPIVTTDSITNLNISNVELLGRVNPNNLNSYYYLQYGTSTSYGSYSDTSYIVAGTNEVAISQYINGLLPATTYHYRIASINSGGLVFGNDRTFTTYGLIVPINLVSEISGYHVSLSWSAPQLDCFSCTVMGYNVYRDSVLVNSQLLNTTNYADSSLVNGIYSYAVTAVYQEGESMLSDTSGVEIAGGGYPDGWHYTRTQNPHIIVIPLSSSPLINGTGLSKGDYIGVFYMLNNIEICGGAARWNGSNTISIIAYGDDSLSQIKDGFAIGEQLNWKIKTWDMDVVADAIATYDNSYSHWDGNYHEFGLSGLLGLNANINFAWDIKVFLEGSFNGINMSADLNNILPTSQPYNIPPWNYEGTESVANIPNSNIIDWVLIELRDTTEAQFATSETMIDRKAAFLLNSGIIVDTDGNSLPSFTGFFRNNLFAVIKHRNHLGIMSNYPLTLSDSIISYNFSDAADKAYGGIYTQKELLPGTWGMIAADGNADGIIDNLDIEYLWNNQAGMSGYKSGDYNMDTEVDNLDKDDFWLPNEGKGSQMPE